MAKTILTTMGGVVLTVVFACGGDTGLRGDFGAASDESQGGAEGASSRRGDAAGSPGAAEATDPGSGKNTGGTETSTDAADPDDKPSPDDAPGTGGAPTDDGGPTDDDEPLPRATGGRSVDAIATGGAIIRPDDPILSEGGAPNSTVDLTDVELPEGCEPVWVSADEYYCDMEMECGGNNWAWVSCFEEEEGRKYCMCEGMSHWGEYELVNVEGVRACEYVATLCLGETAVEFEEPSECTLHYQDTSTDWCSAERECTQSAEVADNASVVARTWQYSSCDRNDSSAAWQCSCDSNGTPISFDYPADVTAADACSTALDVCSGERLVAEGPRECVPDYNSGWREGCDSSLECTRSAQLDGISVQVHEYMYTSCYLTSTDTWDCNCGLANESLNFTLTGEDPFTTLCQTASARCEEELAPIE